MMPESLKYQDEVWVDEWSETAVSPPQSSLLRIVVMLLFGCGLLIALLLMLLNVSEAGAEPAAASVPKINVPYFEDNIAISERAVFWFGEVNETSNYADVRVGYNDEKMIVQVAAFDRLLWFDNTPSLAEIPDWDAATLYVNTGGNVGNAPSGSSYQFLGMHSPNGGTGHFGAYRGSGGSWSTATVNFSINSGTQVSGFNNTAEDRGWWVAFEIPFAALGLSGPPADGEVWGVGVALHDRDDAAGTAIPTQAWPDGLDGERPSTWGQFSFGTPTYNTPVSNPGGTVVIRDGGDGSKVVDAHAGGHSVCGGSLWPDRFFSDWGYQNYAGYPQINIQNQFNLGDWPCFSKYFVTFPLDEIPDGKVILSAELSMYQFGNAGQGGSPTPQPTLLQIATVNESWNEATLNWNNAPGVQENYATSWTGTIPAGGTGFFTTWDVSRAVADLYESGGPLRLSVYTADANRNSGKYFVSSEGAPSKPERRPTLTVVWGDPPLDVQPTVWAIEPGEVATYTISADSLSGPVTIEADNPASAALLFSFESTVINPPETAVLTVTSLHSGGASGLAYTIPLRASAGGTMLDTAVYLFVGGHQQFLPMIQGN